MTKTLRELLSFPSTLLLNPPLPPPCCVYLYVCARILPPPLPPRICFSPTITINPYRQYFPFTLFAPLNLSFRVTSKLKYTSLLTLRVALLSHGYCISVNFYFLFLFIFRRFSHSEEKLCFFYRDDTFFQHLPPFYSS